MSTHTIIMAAAGAGGASYWITSFSNTYYANTISVGTDDSIYIVPDAVLIKLDTNATLKWKKTLEGSVQYAHAGSSGKISCGGEASLSGYGTAIHAQYDTSGNVSWQNGLRIYGIQYGSQNTIKAVTSDSSGNMYLAMRSSEGVSPNGVSEVVEKINSSGTKQFIKKVSQFTSGFNSYSTNGIVADASGNFYFAGAYYDWSGSQTRYGAVVKYNTSGVEQWNRFLGTTSYGNSVYNYGITVAPSGNVYACGSVKGSAIGNGALIAKFNSTGNLQWQKALGSSDFTFYAITCDLEENLYACGQDSSGLYGILAKFNSSGVLQWQRTFRDTTAADTSTKLTSITLDSKNNIIVAANCNTAVALKLPSDGTLTGTYGVYSYATSSYAVTTPTCAVSSSFLESSSLSNTFITTTRTNTDNTDITPTTRFI